jgi:hypothetical protein
MNRSPLIRKLGMVLCAFVLSLQFSPARAADTVHHLELKQPKSIVVGTEAEYIIEARKEDNSLASGAAMTVKVSVVASDLNIEKEVTMKKGKATVRIKLDKAGSYIFNYENKTNDRESGSAFVRVVKSSEVRP